MTTLQAQVQGMQVIRLVSRVQTLEEIVRVLLEDQTQEVAMQVIGISGSDA